MRHIALFFTGGTIAMLHAGDGTVRPALHAADIVSALAGAGGRAPLVSLPDDVALLPVDWADLPSPHMTPDLMFRLARDVQEALARPDVIGAVVTHGTDVMEETAFMLDLLVDSAKPVLVTGAMRSADEAGYDGLRNLAASLRCCLLPLPGGLGVVIAMTDKLFAAREATKIHSMGLDAFDAPGAGPLGTCVAGGVQLFRMPVPCAPLRVRELESRVGLVALAPGMDGSLIRYCREKGDKGLVVEGFGAGNVPPGAIEELRLCVEARMPVVLTSRCIEGGVWPVYGYRGGADDLRDMGLILGGNLRAQKARILLMAALGMSREEPGLGPLEAARRVFEAFPN